MRLVANNISDCLLVCKWRAEHLIMGILFKLYAFFSSFYNTMGNVLSNIIVNLQYIRSWYFGE